MLSDYSVYFFIADGDRNHSARDVQIEVHFFNTLSAAMRYHIYRTGYLMPDYKKGQTLLFEQVTLDMFKAQPRKSGPKPKEAKS